MPPITMVHDRLRDQLEVLRTFIVAEGPELALHSAIRKVVDYRSIWLSKHSSANPPTSIERLELGAFVELLREAKFCGVASPNEEYVLLAQALAALDEPTEGLFPGLIPSRDAPRSDLLLKHVLSLAEGQNLLMGRSEAVDMELLRLWLVLHFQLGGPGQHRDMSNHQRHIDRAKGPLHGWWRTFAAGELNGAGSSSDLLQPVTAHGCGHQITLWAALVASLHPRNGQVPFSHLLDKWQEIGGAGAETHHQILVLGLENPLWKALVEHLAGYSFEKEAWSDLRAISEEKLQQWNQQTQTQPELSAGSNRSTFEWLAYYGAKATTYAPGDAGALQRSGQAHAERVLGRSANLSNQVGIDPWLNRWTGDARDFPAPTLPTVLNEPALEVTSDVAIDFLGRAANLKKNQGAIVWKKRDAAALEFADPQAPLAPEHGLLLATHDLTYFNLVRYFSDDKFDRAALRGLWRDWLRAKFQEIAPAHPSAPAPPRATVRAFLAWTREYGVAFKSELFLEQSGWADIAQRTTLAGWNVWQGECRACRVPPDERWREDLPDDRIDVLGSVFAALSSQSELAQYAISAGASLSVDLKHLFRLWAYRNPVWQSLIDAGFNETFRPGSEQWLDWTVKMRIRLREVGQKHLDQREAVRARPPTPGSPRDRLEQSLYRYAEIYRTWFGSENRVDGAKLFEQQMAELEGARTAALPRPSGAGDFELFAYLQDPANSLLSDTSPPGPLLLHYAARQPLWERILADHGHRFAEAAHLHDFPALASSFDNEVNVLVAGAPGAGKSSLLASLVDLGLAMIEPAIQNILIEFATNTPITNRQEWGTVADLISNWRKGNTGGFPNGEGADVYFKRDEKEVTRIKLVEFATPPPKPNFEFRAVIFVVDLGQNLDAQMQALNTLREQVVPGRPCAIILNQIDRHESMSEAAPGVADDLCRSLHETAGFRAPADLHHAGIGLPELWQHPRYRRLVKALAKLPLDPKLWVAFTQLNPAVLADPDGKGDAWNATLAAVLKRLCTQLRKQIVARAENHVAATLRQSYVDPLRPWIAARGSLSIVQADLINKLAACEDYLYSAGNFEEHLTIPTIKADRIVTKEVVVWRRAAFDEQCKQIAGRRAAAIALEDHILAVFFQATRHSLAREMPGGSSHGVRLYDAATGIQERRCTRPTNGGDGKQFFGIHADDGDAAVPFRDTAPSDANWPSRTASASSWIGNYRFAPVKEVAFAKGLDARLKWEWGFDHTEQRRKGGWLWRESCAIFDACERYRTELRGIETFLASNRAYWDQEACRKLYMEHGLPPERLTVAGDTRLERKILERLRLAEEQKKINRIRRDRDEMKEIYGTIFSDAEKPPSVFNVFDTRFEDVMRVWRSFVDISLDDGTYDRAVIQRDEEQGTRVQDLFLRIIAKSATQSDGDKQARLGLQPASLNPLFVQAGGLQFHLLKHALENAISPAQVPIDLHGAFALLEKLTAKKNGAEEATRTKAGGK